MTDAEAAALTGTIAASGFQHIVIGQRGWYASRMKVHDWLDRVLLPTAGALRVYKDGDLTFGVRPGRCMFGNTDINYAGSDTQALTDDATNYVYLTAVGSLTVNTTGFLTPSETPHLPLATILTADGKYALSDITDYRGRILLKVIGGDGAVPPITHPDNTATVAILGWNNRAIFSNSGEATTAREYDLPAGIAGLVVTIVREETAAGMDVAIDPLGTAHIIEMDGTDNGEGVTYDNTADAFGLVELTCFDGTDWQITRELGTWAAGS